VLAGVKGGIPLQRPLEKPLNTSSQIHKPSLYARGVVILQLFPYAMFRLCCPLVIYNYSQKKKRKFEPYMSNFDINTSAE
jgi:hypothetical protein